MALNVLVVDDSAIMRKMVVKVLRMTGVELGEVHEAANGQEGLQILESHGIDLLFLDMNMPVMTGEEMIENMEGNSRMTGVPVVVISTEGSQTRIERLERKGVRFVRKPFAPEKVREVVLELTGVGHEQPA
jgi:two-component system chemotaxis response regulator CheY